MHDPGIQDSGMHDPGIQDSGTHDPGCMIREFIRELKNLNYSKYYILSSASSECRYVFFIYIHVFIFHVFSISVQNQI